MTEENLGITFLGLLEKLFQHRIPYTSGLAAPAAAKMAPAASMESRIDAHSVVNEESMKANASFSGQTLEQPVPPVHRMYSGCAELSTIKCCIMLWFCTVYKPIKHLWGESMERSRKASFLYQELSGKLFLKEFIRF